MLEGIALRIAQVISNLNQGSGTQELLPIDGGLSGSDYFRQFLADVTGLTVVVPEIAEITGYGAARLALLGSRPDLALDLPPPPAPKRRCPPQRASAEILDRFAEAVERARGWR